MLKRLWRWLKRLIQQLFGRKKTVSPPLAEPKIREIRKQLTDTEYESLFLQLLAGVNDEGWSRGRVKGFLDGNSINQANLVDWLRGFGESLLASSTANDELARRMIKLGELSTGEVSDIAYDIGGRLLGQGGETNREDAKDTKEEVERNITDDAEAWFNQGNEQCEAGDFASAIASYENALRIKPDNDSAWFNRGVALANLGRNEEAIASFDKALAIQPDDHEAWYNRGVVLFNLGRNEEAITSFDKALAIQPDYQDAWNNRGIALGNLGRNEEQIASYDKALAIKPDDHEAWNNRGIALKNLGRNEEAIASYDKALAIKPDDHEAWNNRGIALKNLGRNEEAIASYDKALAIKPDDHEAWNNRGIALGNLGRNEEASADYDKALAIKPDFHQAWNNRGIALRKLERNEEAIASYDKTLAIKPDLYEAWNNRGNALGNLGRNEEAIASYDKALAIKPDLYEAWNNRGNALGNLGREEQAIASYDKALAIKLDYYEAWYSRGIALGNLGRYEQAIASYDEALKFKPDFPEAWTNRGIALVNLNLYPEALKSFESALKINPNFPEVFKAWNGKGSVLADLNQREEAIASFDKALAIKPDYYPAWNNRGVAAGNSVSCDPLLAFSSAIAKQNPRLNQRGYEGQLASYEEGLKYCHQDTHPEAWGELHQAIGNAHYFRGRRDSHPRSYWYKAVKSYNEALKTLTAEDFPELHLEVLQNLIRVQLDLRETAKAEELQRRGTDVLRRLLDECKIPHRKKQLAFKFAGFQQLTVDLAVKSENFCTALELAEQGKNACLSWLLDGWSDDSSKWEEMKQLLNPHTAIVYWHLSPAALHTFILQHNAPSPIVLRETILTPAQRLRDFESWVKTWNEEYANYRKGKDKQSEDAETWRDKLPAMLDELRKILDINAVLSQISDITQLILIPHRDLHRFPLQALFPPEFTISYLPSIQLGLISQTYNKNQLSNPQLLSIEHPNSAGYPGLEFAQVESEAICRIFPNHTRKRSEEATKDAVINALPQGFGILHFTGHGEYNFHNPALSHLALADEDKLTLTDIRDYDLRSYQLVSLAACETAITGNNTITTEYVGLVSGFMSCGVAAVVSTLWTVESAASALVMIQFYQRLQQGKSKVVALTEATQWLRNVTAEQLAEWYTGEIAKLPEAEGIMRRFLLRHLNNLKNQPEPSNQPYNHPYFWAAFTITGIFPSCNQ
ncbi:protein prenyltransferase, alpha subunit [Calothrix sp. NIES-2100]|uniref:CHAT domain-containing protein n=1 Tax=Calothrix sp. NIES-2100 TaxID=1954172 RepID=UPI000B60290F|nr:protein prenyltransferase, alpha subunit [Calothrix sp. NIES-2100]